VAIVAPATKKAAARPIRADLVMIFSKAICPAERTTDWRWLFPGGDDRGRARTVIAMSRKFLVRLRAVTFAILGLAFVAGQPTPVTAEQSYPWCAQGDSILHCYYMTREQCEAAVNNDGFCVTNSNVPTLNNEAPRPRLQRRR
jgi:hypothetical protein